MTEQEALAIARALIVEMIDDNPDMAAWVAENGALMNVIATSIVKAEEVGFKRGYLLACCNLTNLHDQPCLASDVLAEASLTEADLADLSEYDARALAKIRKARRHDPIHPKETP